MALGDSESSPISGLGAGDAIEEAAKSIAAIRKDMEAIAQSAKAMANAMAQAAKVPSPGGGGTAAGGGPAPTSGQGNTGAGAPQQQGTAPVNNTSGGQERSVARMAGNLGLRVVTGGFNLGMAAINDYRVGREAGLDYERQRRVAYAGGVGYGDFRGHVEAAMNPFNVQNRSVLTADVASSMNMGMGAGFGGGTVGERRAAMNMGTFHTVAAMGGMDPGTAKTAEQAIYSAPAFYKALAGGVMTRDPTTGQNYSFEEIAGQYYNTRLRGKSEDELNNAIRPGGGLYRELESTYGAEGADYMIQALRAQVKVGRPLKEGELAEMAKEGEYFGTPYSQGADTESARQQAEQVRIMEYVPRVTEGIANVNDQLVKLNNWLTGQGADSWVGTIEQAGASVDTLGKVMPTATQQLLGGISSLIGGMLQLATALVAAKSLAGGGGGGPGILGKGGKGGKFLKYGVRGLGAVGIAAAGIGAAEWAGNNLSGDTWDTSDTLGTIAAYAGTGAAAGTAIMPGVGTVVGTVFGTATGALRSWQRSTEDDKPAIKSNRKELEPGGRPKHSEGEWFVQGDQAADIHHGEMILPNRIAQAVRDEIGRGKTKVPVGGGGNTVIINLTIKSASDNEAVRFARRVKSELENDRQLVAIGNGKFS